MGDFLDGYSIQYWLESAPQGYLVDTEYGHAPGERSSVVSTSRWSGQRLSSVRMEMSAKFAHRTTWASLEPQYCSALEPARAASSHWASVGSA